MDFSKIKLFVNTVKYLKHRQVYYRFYYFLKNNFFKKEYDKELNNLIKPIKWSNFIFPNQSYFSKKNTFTFLNITKHFAENIDWNYCKYGKLWTYNLNYFDFLNQKEITRERGLNIIKNYIKNEHLLRDGKDPYPISLRGINWVKFLSLNQVKDKKINQSLYNHYQILFNNIEYHLLGNHLLENAFSLLFGSYYFQDQIIYEKSKKILISELNEQILFDGAHFELSPMYHQILFHRLLDCIHLIKLNPLWKQDSLILFLENKASQMNSWLINITYKNGNIPMVNDSTNGISFKSKDLFSYFKFLKILLIKKSLSESGYRKIIFNNYELFIDVGNIGPDYQPAHAHSDTLSFELVYEEKPIFVDTGVSTYEKNLIRQLERSTKSHNTVEINDRNQSDVWGGFRVANRAKIIKLKEQGNSIKATHNGYENLGLLHSREFLSDKEKIIITDKISKSTKNKAKAYFHLHHSLTKPINENDEVTIIKNKIVLNFKNYSDIKIESYILNEGFNTNKKAYRVIVTFDQILKTSIYL